MFHSRTKGLSEIRPWMRKDLRKRSNDNLERKKEDASVFPDYDHLTASSFIQSLRSFQPSRRVKTLYECTAGHDSELSFQPGQIITNVYESKEEGWLVGTLNGKTGLIPANYVEPLP